MIDSAQLIAIFRQKKYQKLLIWAVVIIVALLFLIPFLLSFTPENMKKSEIKDTVSAKINRHDFTVEEVLIESQGWQLARIAFNDKNNLNPSLVILHEENGKLVLKFGPGTSFSNSDLEAAGVPDALLNHDQEEIVDPIVRYLPHQTNNYSLQPSSNRAIKIGTSKQKKPLDLIVYEFPRTGVYATDKRKAQYKNEAIEWIQSIGLNPDNYALNVRGALEND